MKTIKQIADELGIDKQKVYRYIKRNNINEARQDNGTMYYDDTALGLITSHFNSILVSSEPNQSTSNPPHDTVLEVMQQTIATLQEQLVVKDNLIVNLSKQNQALTTALENTTESLKAAQALHAGTIKQQALPEAPPAEASGEPEKRGGFFGWLDRINKP